MRITTSVLKVLGAFLSAPDELSGAQISEITGLASGTLYPILFRLEEKKWLQSEWEQGDPSELGRPRRRFYRITGLGARSARKEIGQLKTMLESTAWTA